MPSGSTTLDASDTHSEAVPASAQEVLALVVVWTASEPRLGEALLVGPSRRFIFGRASEAEDEPHERLVLTRQRPGHNEPAEPLENPFLSRAHLAVEQDGDALVVEVIGKRPLRVGDRESMAERVRPGEYLEIKGLYGFLCVRRPRLFRGAAARDLPPFAEVDGYGIVGESVAAWDLRAQIAFAAGRSAHVLVTGASGTGKELAAQAIHAGSSRSTRKIVSRNAATFPSGLIDAELFGNVANYPNAGSPERPGLVGEADGSTLFLDEIGELPADLQAHLLRVLDGGDYQRLGEARRRRSDVRFVMATNRPPADLKQDLLARLALRVQAPGLNERREDIALLARHILRRIAQDDPQLGERFFAHWDGRRGEPRLGAELVRALTLHRYVTHARELEAVLWCSLSTSRGGFLELTAGARELLVRPEGALSPVRRDVSAEELRAALVRHSGNKDRVWRELGLANRHVLRRLIQKYGIEPPDDAES